ncbi:ceroid-lipofuscinosis neuronal protein 6 homolog [Morone saxatilis]|uniref:ceroid-lipofuscinosis neuronal protein 6 homolog n=1 Tax=Morone saxatilis TaxID=34816 RepID=UPI0015E1D616|nr:ceroid-lipofuscinosis neuronal protein 6 homolog [Morone saxatilis]
MDQTMIPQGRLLGPQLYTVNTMRNTYTSWTLEVHPVPDNQIQLNDELVPGIQQQRKTSSWSLLVFQCRTLWRTQVEHYHPLCNLWRPELSSRDATSLFLGFISSLLREFCHRQARDWTLIFSTSQRKSLGLQWSQRRSAGATETEAVPSKPRFHLDLWLGFTVQNWILDVGRPVVMLVLPADWFPSNRPGAADYLHILYNITTPLVLLKMLQRSPRTLPRTAVRLGIIAVVTGTSLHLAADSVTRRLLLIGYQLHLSVRDNPLMKDLKPPSLIDAFELLFYYDDTIGHLMWYVPLFLVLFLFFSGCFAHRKLEETMPPAAWTLLVPNAAYYCID